MQQIIKNSKKISAERTRGLGKCTVTPAQGKFISKAIKIDLANGRFKKTEDMKKQIIKYANEFHFANPDNSKKVNVLKKSTFYDLLQDFNIPTPLQYKKLNNSGLQSLEAESEYSEDTDICVKGTETVFEKMDSTTQASTNTASYNIEYMEQFQSTELQILDAESETVNTVTTTVQSQVPSIFIQHENLPVNFNFDQEPISIPQTNFQSNLAKTQIEMPSLMRSNSFEFFNKVSDDSVRFSSLDLGLDLRNEVNFGFDTSSSQSQYVEPESFISYENENFFNQGFVQ